MQQKIYIFENISKPRNVVLLFEIKNKIIFLFKLQNFNYSSKTLKNLKISNL